MTKDQPMIIRDRLLSQIDSVYRAAIESIEQHGSSLDLDTASAIAGDVTEAVREMVDRALPTGTPNTTSET